MFRILMLREKFTKDYKKPVVRPWYAPEVLEMGLYVSGYQLPPYL